MDQMMSKEFSIDTLHTPHYFSSLNPKVFTMTSRYSVAVVTLVTALSAVHTSDAFQSIRTTRNVFLPSPNAMDSASSQLSTTVMFGKKSARKGGGGGGGGKPRGQQQQQEKQSVKDARFDAATRQFMFTMVGLTKMLPDKSKKILDNIHLSFYPGAKIGVVGLNGSGKVCTYRDVLMITLS
jgi:ABC-type multidrug transport system fused ATPase/permease subunit